VDIDPDRVYHIDALSKVRQLLRGEERWLRELERDVANGFLSFTKEMEGQREVVASLQRLYNEAVERRMLATTRWVYNSKFSEAPSLLSPEQADVVRAAIDVGKVLRSACQPMKDQSAMRVRVIEFADPTRDGGTRWAVCVEWPNQNGSDVTISDHPTKFDADARCEALLTIAKSLE